MNNLSVAEFVSFPCLSLRQPWGWAICPGPKRTENRYWQMRYRGQMWLHASGKPRWDPDGAANPLVRRAWADPTVHECWVCQPRGELCRDADAIPFGAIVALVTVTGCHHWSQCRGSCSRLAARGAWHIGLAPMVHPLAEPVLHRGARGLWQMDPAAEARARGQAGLIHAGAN